MMTKTFKAVYDKGVIRRLQPLELPEGTHLDVIVVTYEKGNANDDAAEILAGIAALPLEGSNDAFAGRDHDSLLYPGNEVKSLGSDQYAK